MSKPSCYIIFANASYLTPDTYENYSVSLESESPDIPTEQATINSNIIRQPRKFTIDLIFTPYPQNTDPSPQPGADRPQKAVAQLLTAWQLRQTCDVMVKGNLYRNCVISFNYTDDQTDTIKVGCQIKELLIASSASVKVKPVSSKLKKATGKKKVAVTPIKTGAALFAVAHFAVGDWLGAAALAKVATVVP